MCFRCLGDLENEPLKYCHKDKPAKPTVQFRQMVSRVPNAHRTVRDLEVAKKSGKHNVRVDPSLLRLMTSEFGGASQALDQMTASSCSSLLQHRPIENQGLALWTPVTTCK
eukprot:2703819-Amphidinium_carterae.1